MIKLGSDPEVFLKDKEGKLVSSIGKIGGSKMNPLKTENGSVQEDNVLLEFNSRPSATSDEFVANHLAVMKDINEIVAPLDLTISIQPTGVFDDDQLEHQKAKLAGCEPDFDAWSHTVNRPPDLGATNLRSGAGHIHISDDRVGNDPYARIRLVKSCDIAAAIPSILLDGDTTRRDLYGKAGCHRPKFISRRDSYDGVEYRTLSNFWLKSEELMEWAFNAVKMGIDRQEEFINLLDTGEMDANHIQNTINNSDVEAARHLCNEYGLLTI